MKKKLPIYPNFPSFNGKNILMRQVLEMDIPQIKEISFYDGKRATSKKQAIEMQERINQDYENGATFHWAILDKNTGDVVGTCGYYRGFAKNTGELGCVLSAKFRGKGYMTEALSLAINFGFQERKLEKIVAITTTKNKKALQLLVRLNFEKEKEIKNESYWAIHQ